MIQKINTKADSIIILEGTQLQKAEHREQDMILAYLEKDIVNCLYMYADISKYGVDGPHMSVWYDEDEAGLRMIVMKYHNSFQVYTNRGFHDLGGLLDLVHQEKPFGIFGRKEIIQELENNLADRYLSEYGVVFKIEYLDPEKQRGVLEDCTVPIELAVPEDTPAIAQLLCSDKELGRVYTVDSLTHELAERIRTGMGRSYMIRDGERVVAHTATYAECDKFVINSGFIVHPDYRDTEYANWLTAKSNLVFQLEGKVRYFFAINQKLIRWQIRTGTQLVAEYGKLSHIR